MAHNTGSRVLGPYDTINSLEGEIRLVSLLPGDFDDRIEVKLSPARLNNPPTFEALSYVWGARLLCNKLATINDCSVTITESLCMALRHLRSREECRIMWIDALCINQGDLTERTQQVQLMGRIYSSASKVIVWIGPRFRGRKTNVHPAAGRAFEYLRINQVPQDENKRLDLFDGLLDICRRPWFGRVWIIQELALAVYDPLIYCEFGSVTWSHFCHFVLEIRSAVMHPSPSRTFFNAFSNSEDLTDPVDQHDQKAQKHRSDPTEHSDTYKAVFGRIEALRDTREMGGIASFGEQLFRTLPAHASDPRDKVFGLLAISTSIEPIVPDYISSPGQVFAKAMALIIREQFSQSYNHLPLCPPLYTLSSELEVNSWVPDLTMCDESGCNHDNFDSYHLPADLCPSTNVIEELIESSNGICPIFSVSKDLRCITTAGIHLGTIVASVPFRGPKFPFRPLKRDTLVPYIRVLTLMQRQTIQPELMLQALVGPNRPGVDELEKKRTLHAFKRLLYENTSLWDEWSSREQERTNDQSVHDQKSLHEVITTYANRRTLFATREGHVGLTYHPEYEEGIRPGDVLVGLFGINFPFILRPVPHCTSYTMINVSYVANHQWGHSFIKEAARGTKWQAFKSYGLREYSII